MRSNRRWTRALLLGMLALTAACGAAANAATMKFSEALDHVIHLTGALGTDWRVANNGGTGTGLPNGSCLDTAPGLTIIDAVFDPTGVPKGDAYDNGFTFWVDDKIFASPDSVDVTGQTLTSGPQSMSGLDVTVQYTALQTLPVLRMVVALHNPTAELIRPRFRMVTNFGSDGNTTYLATSDGSPTLEYTDTWLASSDSMTTPSDVPEVVVGCGSPPSDFTSSAAPNCFGLDEGAFACNGAQGVTAQFITDVPAGRTIYYMFFGQLAATNDAAIAAGFTYNVNPDITSELIADIPEGQLLTTWNWNFFGEHRLFGGGTGIGTSWAIWNYAGAPDPTGYCEAVPGLSVYDARLVDPERGNAFDNGAMLYVDGQPFASQLHPLITDHHLLAGPVTMSGLGVTVDYTTLADAPTLRTVFSFTNPTDAAIPVVAQFASNLGSDEDTVIHGTSSGDTSFTADDRWIVSGDGSDLDYYAHVTHVLFGPGDVTPPATVSDTTFECIRDSARGIAANFSVTVPPGETRRLMFFNELYASGPEGVAAAALYDSTPAFGSSRVVGLDAPALLETANWAFCSDGSFDSVGCRLESLRVAVGKGVGAGALQDRLTAAVDKARTQTISAQTLKAAGSKGPSRKAIARAIKALQSFVQLLKTKKAKAVAPAERDALTAVAIAQRSALAALKRAG